MPDGTTPTYIAAERGQADVLRQLLWRGGRTDRMLPDGTTALSAALPGTQLGGIPERHQTRTNSTSLSTTQNAYVNIRSHMLEPFPKTLRLALAETLRSADRRDGST